MSVIFMDGFELGNDELWDDRTGTVSSGAAAAGFTENYYCSNNYLAKDVTDDTEYYMGGRFKFSGTAPSFFQLYGNNGGSALCTLGRSSSTQKLVFVTAGVDTTNIGTMALQLNTVYRIEMYWKKSTGTSSDGSLTVKINGVIDYVATGTLRTIGGNDYQCDRVFVGDNGCAFDDFIIDDADWPGNLRIQAIWPDADDTVAWDCSTGSDHANLIDEEPYNDDTDYTYTDTVDEEDIVTLTALTEGSNPIDSVKAVQISARCKQEGVATAQKIQVGGKYSSSTTYSSDLSVQQDAYAYSSAVFNTAPGGGAWSKAIVNDLKLILKSRAGA